MGYLGYVKTYNRKEIIMGIRPEDLRTENIVSDTFPQSVVDFTVDVAELFGHEYIIHGIFDGQKIQAKIASRIDVKADDTIKLALDMTKVHFFDPETEAAIRD